jgi:Conjugal transfer protein
VSRLTKWWWQLKLAEKQEIAAIAWISFGFLLLIYSLAGCAAPQPPPPQIVQMPTPKPTPVFVPPDPYAGLNPEVVTAIKTGQTPTIKSGISILYPYSPDMLYNAYCSTLWATEIRLSPDETTDRDAITIGDTERWSIKVGTHSVTVKPLGTQLDPKMITDLVIMTDKPRSYHFKLFMKGKPMDAIGFYYSDDVKAQEAAREVALKEQAKQQAEDPR